MRRLTALSLFAFLFFFPLEAYLTAKNHEKIRIEACLNQLPLCFIENQGQMDQRVAYYVQGSDKVLYFTSEGVTFAFLTGDEVERGRHIVKLDFINANPKVMPRA
jgi:hypothetical protein